MNASFAKVALATAAIALVAAVGCAAEPASEEGVPEVETGTVSQKLYTGAKISSSSGAIGAGGGGIVQVNPGDNLPPPQVPLNCGGSCTPDSTQTGCMCPGGFGYGSTIVCPAYAPIPRQVWGVWRCYAY
jgi:hypothetical protein